jgi:hypothetical protein
MIGGAVLPMVLHQDPRYFYNAGCVGTVCADAQRERQQYRDCEAG